MAGLPRREPAKSPDGEGSPGRRSTEALEADRTRSGAGRDPSRALGAMLPRAAPPRVAIENVQPRVDEGRVPIRRVPGDTVEVSADVIADGVAGVRACVRWQAVGDELWHRVPMEPVSNDRWRGQFVVARPGAFRYDVEGWVDPYRTWTNLFRRRVEAGSATPTDVKEGADALRAVARQIKGPEGQRLVRHAERVAGLVAPFSLDALQRLSDPEVVRILSERAGSGPVAHGPAPLLVHVDPPIAQHSAWYELFPRSTSPSAGRHGTFRDVRARLRYVADLGFDVVYLPPIHPIGRTRRRGPNNSADPPFDAPGSPWAIGSSEGGHMAVHPDLGTLEEFRATLRDARALGLEVALDLAFQCSPDHPWVREHPEWFSHLPDGTIRRAENPPKKYEDIYPIDFGTKDWKALWTALKEVVEFWVRLGVKWFRVDNPHTKPFEFWRWLIAEVRDVHPEVMFLAEAFTRPKVMYRLAKVGFTHSYTYFAWRTQRTDLEEYFREITEGDVGEYFRPHLWPNTPDILTSQFHGGDRSVFVHRLVLAATLSSHYGLYGPPYELLEHVPLEPGGEEYRDSEKYQIRHWELDAPRSLAPEIRRVNQIRRDHPALRGGRQLTFHGVDNDRLLAYSRRNADGSDVILVVANLDPAWAQAGWTALDLGALGVPPGRPFRVADLWSGAEYEWNGPRNFVRLDPSVAPVHIFHVRPGTDTGRGRRGGA